MDDPLTGARIRYGIICKALVNLFDMFIDNMYTVIVYLYSMIIYKQIDTQNRWIGWIDFISICVFAELYDESKQIDNADN